MSMPISARCGLRRKLAVAIFKLRNYRKERFECPICGYFGPFMDVTPATGIRKHAKCPKCNAVERHRIQFVVIDKILRNVRTETLKMLHFAPEPFFREYFSRRFGQYESADLSMSGVDHQVDLQQLPFRDGSYDFIFASHVLEHIRNDMKAIAEIRRVLTSRGIAVLPVPVVANKTVEYAEPNQHEAYHVRAPGMDYFDRYESYFSKVERFTSDSLPAKYQVFVFEDRTRWPSQECPLRPSMPGERHIDVVPVCYV